MTISIHQPAYIPWMGYFNKIKNSDLFVLLDTVNYSKNSFDNRNKIVVNDQEEWLTIPIKTAGLFRSDNLRYTNLEFAELFFDKHWARIKKAYKNAPYWNEYKDELKTIYSQIGIERFINFVQPLTEWFLSKLDIKTPIVRASSLDLDLGVKDDTVLSLCKHYKADAYLSGIMGKGYLRMEKFEKEGIAVQFQDYLAPNNLSILHNLLTKGAQWIKNNL